MDRISVRWVELVVELETMICVICWETTCFKKTHAYFHRAPPCEKDQRKRASTGKGNP